MSYRRLTPYIIFLLIISSFLYFYMKRDGKKQSATQDTEFTQSVAQVQTQALSKTEIEAIIAEFINNNPKVIIDSVERYYAPQRAQMENGADLSAKISTLSDKIFTPQTPRAGNPEGSIKIVEFFDYNCTFCKKMSDVQLQLLKTNPDIEIFFKDMPIVNTNSNAASRAAIAANMMDASKYLDFHQALMDSEVPLTQDVIFATAKKVGIDVIKLKASMENVSITEMIEANLALANELGIEGIPVYIIDNKMYAGTLSYEFLQELLGKIRNAKSATPAITDGDKPAAVVVPVPNTSDVTDVAVTKDSRSNDDVTSAPAAPNLPISPSSPVTPDSPLVDENSKTKNGDK